MKFAVKSSNFRFFGLQGRLIVNTFNPKRNSHNMSMDVITPNNYNLSKSSTLYVPGRYGGDIYQIVKPVIDINYIEENFSLIDKSCHVRGIELDLKHTLSVLKEWECIQTEHKKVVSKYRECDEEAKRLKALNLLEEAEAELKECLECLPELKRTKEILYDIEDKVMPLVRIIPNIVDDCAPMEFDDAKVITQTPNNDVKAISHVDLGRALSLLEFSNLSPTAYFFKGALAELEMTAQAYFSYKLNNSQFSPLSCVDFCKSFIIEAIGLDHYSYEHSIPIKTNKHSSESSQRLNIVGGASLESFCAYFTNMNIDSSTLPSKYYSLGRRYDASHRRSLPTTLFSVVQSSRIHCIVICRPSAENLEFNSLFDVLLACYLQLDIPFRTVDIGAPRLNPSESRRKQLELWSAAQHQYIPVAHVSQRNNFVSKRLHISYGVQHAIEGYCSIVEGVAVNIPVLLGCIVENLQETNGSINFENVFKMFSEN